MFISRPGKHFDYQLTKQPNLFTQSTAKSKKRSLTSNTMPMRFGSRMVDMEPDFEISLNRIFLHFRQSPALPVSFNNQSNASSLKVCISYCLRSNTSAFTASDLFLSAWRWDANNLPSDYEALIIHSVWKHLRAVTRPIQSLMRTEGTRSQHQRGGF